MRHIILQFLVIPFEKDPKSATGQEQRRNEAQLGRRITFRCGTRAYDKCTMGKTVTIAVKRAANKRKEREREIEVRI